MLTADEISTELYMEEVNICIVVPVVMVVDRCCGGVEVEKHRPLLNTTNDLFSRLSVLDQ